MGGRGSGGHVHWWRPAAKTTAEECLALDANRWARAGIFKAGALMYGQCTWADRRTGQVIAAIAFDASTADPDHAWVRLSYTLTPTGEAVDDWFLLYWTWPHFGGVRWWFTCPVPGAGGPCGRRVGKLYLPPGGRQFGCRRCHRLTYASCRESHKFDRVYRLLARQAGLDVETAKKMDWFSDPGR